MARALPILRSQTPPAEGSVELVRDYEHFDRVVRDGILKATISLDISTADFKAMLIPEQNTRRARSIVQVLIDLANKGVEVRLLHAGVPSGPALEQLAKAPLPPNLKIRRCPRLHAKSIIIDSRRMYLGSANLTGAGLGAKSEGRRNIELGIWTTASTLIDAVSETFNALWEGRECKTCKRHDICPVPLEEPKLTRRR
ncbi:MAG: phospholipase D family protein [Planctomycetota bacterium]|nr:phospholipase D family protein [Planctomycetota bacterium]